MIRDSVLRYRSRVRREFRAALAEAHTPHEIAASFAIGVFVTAMPTGGLGIGLFFLLVYWWSWASKVAMFASVVVLNPLVKPFVYVSSYYLGSVLVGAEPAVLVGHSSIDRVLSVIQHLLIGNLLIAIALAIVGYVAVRGGIEARRRYGGRSFAASDAQSRPRSGSQSTPVSASECDRGER